MYLEEMKVDIPECRRCFCCIPLRYGIITFGYLNLAFSIFVIGLETWLATKDASSKHTMILYKGISFFTQLWFAVLLYTLEAIFSVVLIVGAHWKKPRLLRAYFYYGITTALASFVTLLVLAHHYLHSHWENWILDGSFVFCGFALQTYLLLLIRTELKKTRTNSQMTFINHISEVVVDSPQQDDGRNPL